MPKSCSSDLRERVIAAVGEGATRREAAERFEVSASSAVRWFQAWGKEGRRGPKPRGGSQSPLEGCAEQILALVAERPDWTLEELVAVLRRRRLPGSRSALWRFLERHGISFKKKPASSRARSRGRGPRAPALDPAAGPA
jgi:transposase